jgi:predicted translin family RNA/ssDNA-binding protein
MWRFIMAPQLRLVSGMKKAERETTEEMIMNPPNYVAILALLGEMARRVNENISKVDLKPLQDSLIVRNPSN